mgnify:CR=1 FL=1
MKTIAVIPARYASTRMPGKPLADVLGKPMIWWVYQAAKACPKLDDVLIATDDERIADACKTYGMRYLMTSPDHDTPTGRIWEVSTVEDADLYLQLMGDEPLVNPAAFDLILPDTLPEDPCYVAVLGESHDRRRGARAFRVRDNNRLAAFHDRHAAVRRTKVNTNNLAHNLVLQYLCRMFRKLSDLCSGHCCPNCLIEWGLVGHDLHHRVTENGLVHHVPLLEHHAHRAGFAVIRRTLHDGFLQIRVKLFAKAVNGCHA